MYCRSTCKQMMQRHKSTSKLLNVNICSAPKGFSSADGDRTHRFSPSPHTCTHSFFEGKGRDLLVTCYKFAQCFRKPELIHILNLAFCFIVRHLFFNSHQEIKGSNLIHRAVPLCLSVCALTLAFLISGWAAALATKPLRWKTEKTERNKDYLLQVTFHRDR